MKYYTIATIACLIFSCNQALPTEDMAFKKFISKQGYKNNAMFEFTDFKKTDGIKQDVFGKEVYVIKYQVNKIAKQDVRECQGIGMTYFATDSSIAADSIRQSGFKTGYSNRPSVIKAYKKGELIEEIKGKLNFTNTENGWK